MGFSFSLVSCSNYNEDPADVKVKTEKDFQQDCLKSSSAAIQADDGFVNQTVLIKEEVEFCHTNASDEEWSDDKKPFLCHSFLNCTEKSEIAADFKVKDEKGLKPDGINDSESNELGVMGLKRVVSIKHEGLDIPLNENNVCNEEVEAFHLKKEVKKLTERVYECETCEKRILQYSVFRRHLSFHKSHEIHTNRISCGNRSALRKSACSADCVRRHRPVIPGRRSHACETCGKSFCYLIDLRRHKLIHVREKFQCETCGRWFRYECHLRTHKLIHSGEKPHKCETCGKSFRRASHLICHKSTHPKEAI